jgi:nucleolar protein 12
LLLGASPARLELLWWLTGSWLQIPPPSVDPAPVLSSIGNERRRGVAKVSSQSRVKRKKSAEDNEQCSFQSGSTTDLLVVSSRKGKVKKGHGDSKKRCKIEKSPKKADNEEVGVGLEEAYERKVRPVATGFSKNEEHSENEADPSQLVHETTVKKGRRENRHVHGIPPDETKEEHDGRTIFLGNIPMEVAKSKVCSSTLLNLTLLVSQIVSRL